MKLINIPDSTEFYDILKPNGVKKNLDSVVAEAESIYEKLLIMIQVNDEVFKVLSELGFKYDNENMQLITYISRAKVSTERMQEAVEIDAIAWINDKLASIQHHFVNHELAGLIEVVPSYDYQRDMIMYRMLPVNHVDISECKKLLPISNFITQLWKLVFVSFGCFFAVLCALAVFMLLT